MYHEDEHPDLNKKLINKEIYYQIKLEDILNVDIKNDLYILKLKDNKYFEFDSEELFNLLKQR